jgi:hypothetical protein
MLALVLEVAIRPTQHTLTSKGLFVERSHHFWITKNVQQRVNIF